MNKACIFCNSTGKKSKEHLWPVWMHEFLPTLGDGNHISESNTFQWKDQIGSKKTEKPGYLTTKKLRAVCQKCNNGWMSQLENKIKPILIKVLNRETFDICTEKQKILTRWIAMKSIFGEHFESETHMTPAEDRKLFRSQMTIPEYFSIYIGNHGTEANTGWLRHSMTVSKTVDGPSPPLNGLKRNTQSIGIICGPLFIYVLAIREDEVDPTKFLKFNKLLRIFPIQTETIKWPPIDKLTQEEMSNFAYVLSDIKNHKNVRYGGELP
jgi:hypothetical protein